jgi:hypothetical protein
MSGTARPLTIPRLVLAASGVATLHVFAQVLLRTQIFARAPELMATALALDLTVTAAAFVYWTTRRKAPALSVFGLGVTVSWATLPAHAAATVGILWGAVELVLFVLLVASLGKVVRATRAARRAGHALPFALEEGLLAARLPDVAAVIFARETAAVVYALTGWFRRTPAGPSLVRGTSYPAVAGVLLFLLAVESAALHLLVASASPLVAWILSGTSLYAALWIVGDLHALRLQPPRAGAGDEIVLEVGLRWRISFPRSSIVSIERVDAKPTLAEYLDISPLGPPRYVVHLDTPAVAHGLFGRKVRFRHLGFTGDF